jgi:hypothetical protein
MTAPAGLDDTSAPAHPDLGHPFAVTASILESVARIAASIAGLVLLVERVRRPTRTCPRSTP